MQTSIGRVRAYHGLHPIEMAGYDAIPLVARTRVTDPDGDTLARFRDLHLRVRVELEHVRL